MIILLTVAACLYQLLLEADIDWSSAVHLCQESPAICAIVVIAILTGSVLSLLETPELVHFAFVANLTWGALTAKGIFAIGDVDKLDIEHAKLIPATATTRQLIKSYHKAPINSPSTVSPSSEP